MPTNPPTTDMKTALLRMHGQTLRLEGQRWKLDAREFKARFSCDAECLDPKDAEEAKFCCVDLERSHSERSWRMKLAFAVAGGYREEHPGKDGTIPQYVRDNASKLMAKLRKENLGGGLPHWYREVPARGIPVVFAQRGTYKPGTPGWIIDGHARTVYVGPDSDIKEMTVGEFVVVIPSGSQCLAQVGRDISFVAQ